MASAKSLEAGGELHGVVKLEQAGQIRQLFSDLWEGKGWHKHVELMLGEDRFLCVPSKRGDNESVANGQEGRVAGLGVKA